MVVYMTFQHFITGLISDAFHLTFGCGLLMFSLLAMSLSQGKPDGAYTYGYVSIFKHHIRYHHVMFDLSFSYTTHTKWLVLCYLDIFCRLMLYTNPLWNIMELKVKFYVNASFHNLQMVDNFVYMGIESLNILYCKRNSLIFTQKTSLPLYQLAKDKYILVLYYQTMMEEGFNHLVWWWRPSCVKNKIRMEIQSTWPPNDQLFTICPQLFHVVVNFSCYTGGWQFNLHESHSRNYLPLQNN